LSPAPDIASESTQIGSPQKTAKTSHFSGYKSRGFKGENLGFKPNIGDFGAGFWGIRINILRMDERSESGCVGVGPGNGMGVGGSFHLKLGLISRD
tara:strand:+ start:1632 stop:1919 length:288 start_codon:yes stop_codon:yes gene_type:complete